MSDIPEHWNPVYKTSISENFKNLKELSNYSPILIKILLNRELKTENDIIKFLKGFGPQELHSPLLIPNIDFAVKRLLEAISNKEKIAIFGDYDADGIISAHIIADFLKKCGIKPKIHIPDRIEEGYDISIDFVKNLKKNNPQTSLIICVDCGTNSAEVIDFVNKNREYPDIIAADHHKMNDIAYDTYSYYFYLKDENNNKYIIVNPHFKNSGYPFKDISGAFVSFKLVNAVLMRMKKDMKNNFKKNYLTSLIDLVAVSTVTDLMPLRDENRIIVKWGLNALKKTKNKGLKQLLETVLSQKTNFTTYDLGFVIGPRLNAAGRVRHGKDSYDLLDNDNQNQKEILMKINNSNENRKKIQEQILNAIIADKNYDFHDIKKNKKIFIAKSTDWHEGLIGVVASDLVKKLRIPVILFNEKTDMLKGSGRSIESFDLFKHLNKISHLLKKFGGHAMACGITLNAENVEDGNINTIFDIFKTKMEEIAKKNITDKQIQQSYKYDCEVNFSNISAGLHNELKDLEPFGIGNPRPIFLTKNCQIKEIKFLKNNKHVSLLLEESGFLIRALKFNLDTQARNKFNVLGIDDVVSVLYYIDENFYNGISCLQLILVDLHLNKSRQKIKKEV